MKTAGNQEKKGVLQDNLTTFVDLIQSVRPYSLASLRCRKHWNTNNDPKCGFQMHMQMRAVGGYTVE